MEVYLVQKTSYGTLKMGLAVVFIQAVRKIPRKIDSRFHPELRLTNTECKIVFHEVGSKVFLFRLPGRRYQDAFFPDSSEVHDRTIATTANDKTGFVH